MTKNPALLAALALFLGLAAGYGIGMNRAAPQPEAAAELTMRDAMHDMTAGLHSKTGDALDEAFLRDMIVHHEGAIEMAETLRAGTERPELVVLADDIIAAQTQEISLMQQWHAEWFAHSH